MTRAEFEKLHDECGKTLADYTKAATTLCKMLGELSEGAPTLADRSRIMTQRTKENDLFDQYHQIRGRLLKAAQAGYGDL